MNTINDILKKYLENINNNGVKSPYSEFYSKLDVHPHILKYLISAIPESLLSIINEERKQFSDLTEFWNLSDLGDFDNIDGTLTCHALSPMGDSIFLISDLGRALRISSILDKQLSVLLADKEWSSYNWVVQDYGTHNLTKSFEWRKDLYKSLGLSVDQCNLSNINNGEIAKEQIEKLASEFEDFSRAVFGSKYIGKKLNSKEINDLKQKIKIQLINEPKIDLLELNIFSEKLIPERTILEISLNYLRKLDQTTFTYYFTQRYHQYKYKNFLKLAIRSEKQFDRPFFELDKLEGAKKFGVTKSIYFSDYVLFEEDMVEKFVIPYYFPSGSLYNNLIDIDNYSKDVILLDDYQNKDKFIRIFSKMPYPHNARLLSDLLSFVHFYIFPQKNSTNKRTFKSSIDKIIREYDIELLESWKYYARPSKDFRNRTLTWSDYIFSNWPKDLKTPYYILPFIKLKEESELQYANLTFEIFRLIIKNIKFPQWFKK